MPSEYWSANHTYKAYWEKQDKSPIVSTPATDSINIACSYAISQNQQLNERFSRIDTIKFLELHLTITNNSSEDIYFPSLDDKICADLYDVIEARDHNRLMQEDIMKKEALENADLLQFNWGAGPKKYRFSYLGNILDYGSWDWEKSYTVVKHKSESKVICMIPIPSKSIGHYKVNLVASTVDNRR